MAVSRRIAILGVTGFIGRGLPRHFSRHGIGVTGVSRAGKGGVEGVDAWETPETFDPRGHEIVVNLAGERIDRRWTSANRRRIRESRVDFTRDLVARIAAVPAAERPSVLVNGSAVGIYGDRGEVPLGEQAPSGVGFLAELCRDWEEAALEAGPSGVRVVRLRTGIVLGEGGPAFEKLRTVFRWGLGGVLGDGRQWMPWVHVEDLRNAIVHAALDSRLAGPIHGVAPEPERNADFTRKLAEALHRPALFRVPGAALRLALGGFGGELLASCRAKPEVLLNSGFLFQYPALDAALRDLIAGDR